MSKKTAHTVLILIDLLAIFALWLGYDEIRQILTGLADAADTISFNNRVGFLFVAVLVPMAHIYAICEYFFLKKIVIQKAAMINGLVIMVGCAVFAFAFFISKNIQTHVEEAGYHHCPAADDRMTFSTYLVFTKDETVCRRLVLENKK